MSTFSRSEQPNERRRFTPSSKICAVAAIAIAALAPPHAWAANPNLVQTTEGPVDGFVANGIVEFLGIPYAAPPVGTLRWRPPQNHATWTKKIKATTAGPICLQVTTLGPFAGPANANEDCLYLNVYTPNVDPSAKERLPVIVWIHGGGNVDGGSTDYDGSKLASQGHTVVVTINYRLGLLGFMANPAIDAENHPFANYGIMDQQQALKWVRRNIARFGGDPKNVTLGGQSAGSVDTESNVMSPGAAGLFQHAIFESVLLEPSSLSNAEKLGTEFSVAAGCGSGATAAVAKCLRALTAQQIFNLSGTPSTEAPYESNIIADGQVIPTATFTSLISAGTFNHVSILSGTVEDEANFNLGITEFFESPRHAFTATDYQNTINAYNSSSYPSGTAARLKTLYPLSAYATPQLAMDAIGTDPLACEQRAHNQLFAGQVQLYAYEFDDQTAPSYFPKMPGFQPLAYHTSDIQYLWPLWHGGPEGIEHTLNQKQETLSDELVAAWTNFAWSGNPNGQGNAPWPLYKPKTPNVPSIFSENIPNLGTFTDAQFNAKHQCNFWASVSTW